MDKIIKALASDLRNTVKIGVEIETQLATTFDEMACRESIEIDATTVCNAAGLDDDRSWIRAVSGGDVERLAEVLDIDLDTLLDEQVDYYRDDRDSCFWDHGVDTSDEIAEALGDDFEVIDDCSISGKEFIFNGPVVGVQAALSRVASLFEHLDGSDFTIDQDCSCHIHIQFPDMIHTGSNTLQQLIFEELFKNVALFPKTVKDRIRKLPRWIKPTDMGDFTFKTKYNPIQKHHQGTWEFRLFGNVQNVVEFSSCLELAIGALARAYARYVAGGCEAVPTSEWVELARICMRDCVTMETAKKTWSNLLVGMV